jgi:tRNA dimethylallyltransferase
MDRYSNIKFQISNIPPLVVIVGETASGKTAAAIDIAQKIGGEIICADSRTVYKQMDIGTAKPSKQEQELVKHHLIDVVKPNQKFSAAEFKRLAEKCIQDIHRREKIPIVVGGTGLYIDSLLYNFQFNDKPNDKYRAELEQMSDEDLTTLLNTKNIDITHLNTKNRRHVIRAIERDGEVPQNKILRKNTMIIGLRLDRDVLKLRIQNRVEQMFADGFVDEVERLVKLYGWDIESMSGIGYRVVRDYLEGIATLEDAKVAFVRRDISLAKRQRTWFKRNSNIKWFNESNTLINEAVEFTNSFNYNS